jgi:hypothetical protein
MEYELRIELPDGRAITTPTSDKKWLLIEIKYAISKLKEGEKIIIKTNKYEKK